MSGPEFSVWLELMKTSQGLNKKQCAALLGRTPHWVTKAQERGADRVTALACAALLHGLEPFWFTAAP